MASFPFLSVCPIQFHFRLLICVDISISSVHHSSSFEITSGQWRFWILRKQQLTKVCSFEVVVFISFHVSDPYNNTDLTLLRNSSEISPTRCNNCVFILRNGFTLHVSGDNLTHHQEYICCIWPQVSRLT